MNCQTCGYSLMNLTGGNCPECGEAFDLLSYHFVPGSVAFACPHCDHQHAGQGEHYQPADDDKAVCRACGEHMPLSSIRVVPLVDDAMAQPLRQTPWERAVGLNSRWSGWWQTCRMSLLQPAELGELIAVTPRVWWAVCFPLLACMLVSLLWELVLGGIKLALHGLIYIVSDSTATGKISDLISIIKQVEWYIFCTPWPLFLHLLLAIPTIHLILILTGKTQSDFSLTASAVAYGHGPAILCLLPGIGLPVASIWILTSTISIVSSAQKVSFFRATAACLVVPVFLIGTPIVYGLYKLIPSFL